MGTELVRHRVQEENIDIPSIPPGFESLASFSLKRIVDNEIGNSCSASASASELQTVKMDTECDSSEDTKISRSVRSRSWINYGQIDNSSGDETDTEQNLPSRPRLPKGVIRGCEQCRDCQKVIARWHPDEACRPCLDEAPVFYPNEEEFKDTLNYIASIRPKAETYGICRIVPPPSWKPPCPLKEQSIRETSKFHTRIQRVDKLQNRDSMRKILKVNIQKKRKRRRCTKSGVDHGLGSRENLVPGEAGMHESERFGFEPGPEFTLDAFKRYADDFKAQYFGKDESIAHMGGKQTMHPEMGEPSLEDIEGEYWRMVEKPTEEIEVLYGADLETGVFGSGFPKLPKQVGSASDEKYVKSGWNLNNFPRLPGSVLSFESSDISGVLVPWLYIGMCFSSFCWHVEDHHLYSLNYMHWGAPKMWYGVPGQDAMNLEAAMRKHLPDLFEEQPDLLHKLVTQLSPSILKSEGVRVYRCLQKPGEFVLTFPRAYHAGFNCGFNCAEAVNVAPVDWLPHGQNAIELYRKQARKTSISHDKLLLGAAREAVKAHWELNILRKNTADNLRWRDLCGTDGILSKALRARVEMERLSREFHCSSSQALKMETSFDATDERECSVCLFDLHLSAAGCHHCSPDKYACLYHAKQLCSCSWGAKFFLFRYDVNELNILVEALEGKLSAVCRWARLDLGLALSSCISKENSQVPGVIGKSSYSPSKTSSKIVQALPCVVSLKEQKRKENIGENSNFSSVNSSTCVWPKEKLTGELLAGKNTKGTLPERSQNSKRENCSGWRKNEESINNSATQGGISRVDKLAAEKSEIKKSSFSGSGDVILLSDDGSEESNKQLSKTRDFSIEHLRHSQRQAADCNNNPVSTSPAVTATVMARVNFLPDEKRNINSLNAVCTEDKVYVKEVILPQKVSMEFSRQTQDSSSNNEMENCNVANLASSLQRPIPYDSGKTNVEDRGKNIGSDSSSRSPESVQSALGNSNCTQNNLDRYFQQKGPRIAKVVRRINCNVEPLEFGVINSGKLWCDSRAIYPQGFRSRVRYISILDPRSMCYYVSEILDAGRDGPLFMVSVEHCASEVFAHLSASRCWEMVRERVNQEIARQHKLGKMKLPPLQPPGSLDGMEMFGFSSPEIVQVIQSMDQKRVCAEYWKSRPLMYIPQNSQAEGNASNLGLKSDVANSDSGLNKSLPAGVDTILSSLFKKANPKELRALYSVFSNNNSTIDQGLVTKILNEEINKRSR